MTVQLDQYAVVRECFVDGIRHICNGADQPRMWNGRETDGASWRIGELAPEDKATDAEKGAGNLTGTYYYYYTYSRDELNGVPAYESGPSPVSDGRTVTSKEITVTYTDAPSGVGYTHVKIYRYDDADSTPYLVVKQVTGSTTYDDDTADLTNNAQINLRGRTYENGLPPKFRDMVYTAGRLIGIQGFTVSVSEPYPRHEHFYPTQNVNFDDEPMFLAVLYEDVYVFCRHSIWRLLNVMNPLLIDRLMIHGNIGSIMPPTPFDQGVVFADPGRGPYFMDLSGQLDPIGLHIKDTWKTVHLDMLEHGKIEIDPEERRILFFFATGTKPYFDLVMGFEWAARQWEPMKPQGIGYAVGAMGAQGGNARVLLGTVTGTILQFGEDTDLSYGAYLGTLTGTPTTVGGYELEDTTATFNTEITGATLLCWDDDGEILYRGIVTTRPASDTIRCYPMLPATVTTASNYGIGAMESYWTTKLDDLDNTARQTKVRWLEVQGTGDVNVSHAVDNGDLSLDDTVDLDTDESEVIEIVDRGHLWRFRIWNHTPGEAFLMRNMIAEGIRTGARR